ncbi:MAG: hypothetical protein AAFY33_01125 [Cyanobacteria bacterium J06643_4]
MKVKYFAALAAASVFGVTALTSCGPNADVAEPDAAVEEVDPCAAADPCAADPCAADPCAADPCAADPCAADPCAAE